MIKMDEVALSQLPLPEKPRSASPKADSDDEIPLASLIKKKKKKSKSSKEDSEKKKKKKKKKRSAETSLEGETKKKIKSDDSRIEAHVPRNETDDQIQVIGESTKPVKVEAEEMNSEKKKKKKKKKKSKSVNSAPSTAAKLKSEPRDEKVRVATTPKKKLASLASVETSSASQNGVLSASQEKSLIEVDDDTGDHKWWEDTTDILGPRQWTSLVHNGPLFPPPYKPLPSHVKLYYDGKPVDLPVAAEEVAGFYAEMLLTDHAKKPVFQANFFGDFLTVLRENGGSKPKITKFDKCDFSKMYHYLDAQKELRRHRSPEEIKRVKDEKDERERPHRICILDGREEEIATFKIEPPGLFRGRGAHPKTGKLKRRIVAEDITINIGVGVPIPEPPAGHKWRAIKHDTRHFWLAMWREDLAGHYKYVRFAATSSIKGQSDMRKFEIARELKNHIGRVRRDYAIMMKDPFLQTRQLGTATYLIDVFALRAGGEKSDDEADTVGCCSLRYEHVTLKPPNTVIFDFLGKDSIRYYQEVNVERQAFKNFRIFKKHPKQPGDDLFDRIAPPLVNKHLQLYMKGLTAKVFRTYNASKTMQEQMDLMKNEGTVAQKVLQYNAANRKVAILCNHQRTVGRTHSATVEKMQERIKEQVWKKLRYKRMLLGWDPSAKNTDPAYFADLEDVSKEDLHRSVRFHIGHLEDLAKKKWAKDNEKRSFEKQELLTKEDLDAKLQSISELKTQYEREVESGVVAVLTHMTPVKIKGKIEALEERIKEAMFQLTDKEENSEVSLGTSKLNYIDPRLTVMFSKKFGVPIERLFAKTLREKFKWAIESTGPDWRF